MKKLIKKSKTIDEQFTWEEFYDRFVHNYEEFVFIYKDNLEINISYVSSNTTSLSYGNDDIGFLIKDYNSPYDFLEDPVFEGKVLKDIWDELK